MASATKTATRKPTDGRASDAAPADAERSAEEQVTILARQLAFARNHFFVLAQRYAASKVEAQQLTWENGADLINGEMTQLDAALTQIGDQS